MVINASIGARNTVTTTGAYSNVDFIIYANNALLARGAFNRFSLVNGTTQNAFNTSAINTVLNIAAGTTTFEVRTARSNGNSPVDIGGNAALDTNPGELTLTVYYTPITTNRPAGGGEGESTIPVVVEAENTDPNAPMTNKRAIVKEKRQND